MSRLLAIDASSKTSSVALFIGVRTPFGLVEYSLKDQAILLPSDKSHSEKLMPAVHQLLEKNGGPLSASDSLSVTIGPGSFTSLRVALSTAMALAQPLDLPIYPLSSLMLLAWPHLKNDGDSVSVSLKAGRGRYYAARYCLSGKTISLVGEEGLVDSRPVSPAAEDACPLAIHAGEVLSSISVKALSWKQLQLNYIQAPDFG